MRKTLGIIGAVITCPCHIPIWVGLVGGTGIGAALARNLVATLAVATLLFGVFLALALAGSGRSQDLSKPQENRR